MRSKKLSATKIFSTLVLAACALTSTYTIANAQGGSGFSIIKKEGVEELSHFLDFGGQRNARDRYRLRIPGKKLIDGAAKFFISYPDYFDGKFDTEKIEVRVKETQESLPLREVIWDQESRIIEISLEESYKESRKLELVFSRVKNPDVGTYYFHAQVLPATNIPERKYVGSWILSINP